MYRSLPRTTAERARGPRAAISRRRAPRDMDRIVRRARQDPRASSTRSRAPEARPGLPRTRRRRHPRTGAAACRRWRAPAAWQRDRRLRRASAPPARILSAETRGNPRAPPSRAPLSAAARVRRGPPAVQRMPMPLPHDRRPRRQTRQGGRGVPLDRATSGARVGHEGRPGPRTVRATTWWWPARRPLTLGCAPGPTPRAG